MTSSEIAMGLAMVLMALCYRRLARQHLDLTNEHSRNIQFQLELGLFFRKLGLTEDQWAKLNQFVSERAPKEDR